ncbi:helix-turn-helix domain-containing protein [Bacillus chungangensis]|uniref:Cytoskeletal protein RodZ n=1 Tax=Bacillus chungangensis TaxID=587633 RepID=A0ABT9WR17_9BACI|nr:RodZ domain-containing protein [Bacillus chungangensis]MDQ0175734.1 cytoskeletal protein RodZ [Bacillus chungangensis]
MTNLGDRLKEERKAKGLDLDDLQRITKIQKRYLIGIEEGNYEMIPGKFYVRAFIKQYAEAVGLQPEALFEEYKKEIPVAYEDDLPEQLSRVQARRSVSPANAKIFQLLPKILVVTFIVVAVLLAWYFLSKSQNQSTPSKTSNNQNEQIQMEQKEGTAKDNKEDKDDNKKEKDKEDSADEEEDSEDQEEDASEPEQSLSVVGSSGKQTTYELSGANKFELKIAATGKAWVGLKDSTGKFIFQKEFQEGDSETFDLIEDKSAFIVIGNASSTDIFVNGEQLKYEISPTDIVRQDVIIQFTGITE